jgi:hypothetical protein
MRILGGRSIAVSAIIPVNTVTTGGPRLMAKKSGENPKMPASATETELRSVRLQLPVDDHKKLRRLAADQDTNMAILARRVMMEYIASHTLKGSSK